MATNPVVRAWFKNMSKPEKVEWCRRNKYCNEPGKGKAFDDAATYEEMESKAEVQTDDAVVKRIPLDDWIIRQKALGKCGQGTEDEKNQVATDHFNAMVADCNIHTPKVQGQYLVPIFSGTEERVGTHQKRQQQYKRQKTVNDNVDQATSEEIRAANAASSSAWKEEHINELVQHLPSSGSADAA